MWLNPPFPSLWEWPVRIQAPFSLDHVEVLVPKQKLSPSCRIGSISYGSIWYLPACSIYSTLYSVFICFYWDESQASKRQTALIQWWHMPLKTVFLFFFFFFWESRMEAVYSDSCGCLNKRGRWSVGRSFTLPPALHTDAQRRLYISILLYISTGRCFWNWIILWVPGLPGLTSSDPPSSPSSAHHIHGRRRGHKLISPSHFYPLRTARCSLERVWKGSRFTERNGPCCKDGAAIWLTSHWMKTKIIFRIKAGLGKLPGTASLVSQVSAFRILVRSLIKPWFLLLMIRLL